LAGALIPLAAHGPEASTGLGRVRDLDAADTVVLLARSLESEGIEGHDALAAAAAALAVSWGAAAAALLRAGTRRWEVDLLLLRCGLDRAERQRALDGR